MVMKVAVIIGWIMWSMSRVDSQGGCQVLLLLLTVTTVVGTGSHVGGSGGRDGSDW